jgi:hypothetical protein
MDRIAAMVKVLDEVADKVEKQDPKIALAIDHITDRLEKKAYFNPTTWLPGRSPRDFPVLDYGQKRMEERMAVCNCSYCNAPIKAPRGSIVSCPRCGHSTRA